MEKHLNFVHLCLGSKRSFVTCKRQCLSTQGAVAHDLICFKVTLCSRGITSFSFLADQQNHNNIKAKNVLSNSETNVVQQNT